MSLLRGEGILQNVNDAIIWLRKEADEGNDIADDYLEFS